MLGAVILGGGCSMMATFFHGVVAGITAFIVVGIVESWLNFKIA